MNIAIADIFIKQFNKKGFTSIIALRDFLCKYCLLRRYYLDIIWLKPVSIPTPKSILKNLRKLKITLDYNIVTINSLDDFSNNVRLINLKIPYTSFYPEILRKLLKIKTPFYSLNSYLLSKTKEIIFKSFEKQNKTYDLMFAGHHIGGHFTILMKKAGLTRFVVYYDRDRYPIVEGIPDINCFEHMIVKKSDIIWSVSKTLARIRKNMGAKNVIVVPHGVYYDMFSKALKSRSKKSRDYIGLIYIGSLSNRWFALDLMLNAFEVIIKRNPKVKLFIAGDGPFREKIIDFSKRFKKNVRYLGIVSYNKLPHILSLADIGLVPLRPKCALEYGIPLKVKEYMAAGLPIVSTKVGETPKLLEEAKCGISANFDEREFVLAIEHLVEDSKTRKTMAKNAHSYAKNFDWNNVFEKALETTSEILGISI